MADPAQADLDGLFLRIATALAKASLQEGGLPSGGVLVEQGVISGKGIDRCLQRNDSTATAAMDCLRQATPPVQPRKATLYLTLSPCPLAASVIVERGIARVVLAEGSLFRESIAFLRSRGVEVVLKAEPAAAALLRQFVVEQAPSVAAIPGGSATAEAGIPHQSDPKAALSGKEARQAISQPPGCSEPGWSSFPPRFVMSPPVQTLSHKHQLSVAAAQGLRWLLDDLLDAEQELVALLATPTGVPAGQRERLAGFCTRVGRLAVAQQMGGSGRAG